MTSALLVEVHSHDGRFHGVSEPGGSRPEWPPSPFRLFQAIVAGAYGGRWRTEPRAEKDAALTWLEGLEPPVVVVPPATALAPLLHYVPNNDLDAHQGDPAAVAEIRTAKRVVGMCWDAGKPLLYVWTFDGDEAPAHRVAGLVDRVHTFGHGIDAAWASARVLAAEAAERWVKAYGGVAAVPAGTAATGVSVPAPGSLASLDVRYTAFLGRLGWVPGARIQAFRQPPKPHLRTVAYDRPPGRLLYELRPAEGGPGFRAVPAAHAVALVTAVRDRLFQRLSTVPQAIREQVVVGRGHPPATRRVRIVPLPTVGHEHAGPGIRRVLVEVPAECPIGTADVEWALAGQVLLVDGQPAEITLSRSNDFAMAERSYGVGARLASWASVTPVALPVARRPGRWDGAMRSTFEAAAVHAVRNALRHAGHDPSGVRIRVQAEPTFARGTNARDFDGGRFEPARLLHVRVDLPRAVDGPLVIGDGRWLGLGVMARAEPPERTLALLAVSAGAVAGSDVHAQGRRLHAAIAATLDGVDGADPLALLGRNGEVTAAGHGHAHLLFLDLDRDDRLDHVLVWIPDGIAPASLEVLDRLRRLWTAGKPSDDLELVLVADGEHDTLARSFPALAKTLGSAASWTSATPFVAPRHVKLTGRNSLEGQVRWLAEQRGLPSPVVDLLDPAGFSDFGIADGRHRPPTAHRHRLRLRFPHAVSGPICLGFGAHHGLGRFEADE